MKDSIFQPSSAERHDVELMSLLDTMSMPCPVIFVMRDGSPNHNCRHLAVHMAWLSVFLKIDMGMLEVSRCAPNQS